MWTSLTRCRPSGARARSLLPLRQRALLQSRSIQSNAELQRAESLYVSSTEVTKHISPVMVGLAHFLEQKYTKVGFFRPIVPSSSLLHDLHHPLSSNALTSDHHVELMASQLNLDPQELELYTGVDSDTALESWFDGKEGEVIETILTKFEKAKAGHDFMIIEGCQISPTESSTSWKINTDLAKAFGSPMLLLTDLGNTKLTKDEQIAREIVKRTRMGKEEVEDENLLFFGTIANRVPTSDPQAFFQLLQKEFAKEKDLPFLGFLPKDELLASKRLAEVATRLGARKLFEKMEIPNNVVVTDAVVGTSHLKDLFTHMQHRPDGLLMIASADRADILLGLLASRISGLLPNVAGIVLTNGNAPTDNVREILQGVANFDKTGLAIPTFIVSEDSYKTAVRLSNISTDVLPTSHRKIAQSKYLFDQFIAKEKLVGELDQGYVVHRTPKQFQHFLFNKARSVKKTIVLPESEDMRVLEAADEVLRLGLAKITILGDPVEIKLQAKRLNLDLSEAKIVHPKASKELSEKYASMLYEKRKKKGLTMDFARDMVADYTYFATMMVEAGDVDGMVSGACHTTANTVRPALQIIKTHKDRPLVSSVFFMLLEDGVRLYADCALNTEPNAQELATIAVQTAGSAEAFGMIPRVALLSYATGDSNSGPLIDKIREATVLARKMRPDLDFYGPIQYDAAVNARIAKGKLANEEDSLNVGGKANVLIFPDLNTGNNTYKAVQQSTKCDAIGPMLQGLRKPVNDLSRGATVKDIVTTIAVTALQGAQVAEAKAKAEAASKGNK